MEFQECSIADALIIFPIAWKHQITKLMKKCTDVLRFTDLNKNVCVTLNMACSCGCRELFNNILIQFLFRKNFTYKLLDEEEYYSLLEPKSMKALLNLTGMDSYIIGNVFKWADSYLKKHEKSMDIKNFLEEHELVPHLKLENFETISAVVNFHNSELGKGFFTYQELWSHVENLNFKNRESSWCKIKAGEILTEKFVIEDLTLFENSVTTIFINRNPVVLYDYFPDRSAVVLTVDISCNDYRHSSWISDYTFYEYSPDTEFVPHFLYYLKILRKKYTCSVEKIIVEVKFKFHVDGRILKQSPDTFKPIEKNDGDLCFVNSVGISLKGAVKTNF